MFKTMFSKAKSFVSKTSLAVGAAAVSLLSATAASAAGEPSMTEISDGITSKMGEIVSTSLIVLGSVAGLAIILFGGIYAWRYGKKVLSVVAGR